MFEPVSDLPATRPRAHGDSELDSDDPAIPESPRAEAEASFRSPDLAIAAISSSSERSGRDVARYLSDSSSRPGIHAQHLYKSSDLLQVFQRQAHRWILARENVHIEAILPGLPSHRTRLNLAQIQIAQGKHAERLEQRPGHVL